MRPPSANNATNTVVRFTRVRMLSPAGYRSARGLSHRKGRLIGPPERHAIDHGLHRLQRDLAVALVVAGVDEGHRAFDQFHDRYVAGRADLQRTDFGRAIDDLRG